MASYEKQTLRGIDISGPGGSLKIPPEVLVCIDCGSMVWPTRVSLHDAWHASLQDAAKQTRRLKGMYSTLEQSTRRRR